MSAALALFTMVMLLPQTLTRSFEDHIVVVATGEPERASDVAAAVSVIDRDEIASSGAAAVADLLRRVPGVTVLRSGLDTGVTSLFTRGTASTQTLVLFDGVRLNSPFFGGYDWGLPMTAGIERIEVARGPFSALYGGDAIGGVVQLIPRRPESNELQLSLEGGDDWRRLDLFGSARKGRWSATATAAARTGDGALQNDAFASTVGMLDIGYDLEGGRIGLLVRRTTGRTEIPFEGARPTPERRTEASELLVAAPVRVGLTAATELEVTPSWVVRDLAFRDPDDPWGYVASDTEAQTGGLTAAVRHGRGRHRLTLGAEWRRDRVVDGSSYGTNLSGVEQTTWAIFAQDGVTLGHGVSVLAGVRWDHTQQWGSELAPRMTVSWRPGSFTTWAAWGEAFRAPSLGELYYPFSGNPLLDPERSHSFELGASGPVGASSARLQLVAFRNRTRNLIQYEPATLSFANVAHALQDGVELSLTVPVSRSSWAEIATTWLDARDADGAALLRRPEWSGAVTWRVAVGSSLDGEAALTWVGSRTDLDPTTLARVDNGGFVSVSAAVRYALSRGLSLRARLENLADRYYEEVRGYPAPGRRLLLALETVVQ